MYYVFCIMYSVLRPFTGEWPGDFPFFLPASPGRRGKAKCEATSVKGKMETPSNSRLLVPPVVHPSFSQRTARKPSDFF
jgi:hypothetical protein